MYWISGLAPVATSVVTPLMVFMQVRSVNKSAMVKYNQLVNEVVRQFISGTIGLVAYFGGGELTKGLLKAFRLGGQQNDSEQEARMMLGGLLMSFIGYAFVRPLVCTKLICKFLKEKGLEHTLSREQIAGLMEKASRSSASITQPEERQALIDQTIASLPKKALGDKPDRFPISVIQNGINRHLFDRNGNPLLAKTAVITTGALAGWLLTLTGALYGLNQMLRRSPIATKTQSYPIWPVAQWGPPPASFTNWQAASTNRSSQAAQRYNQPYGAHPAPYNPFQRV